jgi:aldehyde:ferredoxin oxidoreductase
MPYVYSGKYLRIDLTNKRYRVDEIPDEWVEQYALGSGLAAKIFYDEMDPSLPPLDPRSPLVMFNGLLSGTFSPTGCRSSWCGRSPLTGIWNEANMGGHFGAELRFAGFDGFIIIGRAAEPTYLWIDGGAKSVEFRRGAHVWGLDHFDTFDTLRAETDPKAQIACIGPAGENLVLIAGIMQGGRSHARTAGRGGMGALLGSKNLKAIAVRGREKPTYADAKGFNTLVREQNNYIKDNSVSMMKFGTPGGIPVTDALGDLPINNWRDGNFPTHMNISGQRIAETVWVRHTFCHACPIGCGNEVELKEGPYAGTRGEGPEYETLALIGANLKIDDLQYVIKANDLCNRYGMDTISTGAAIALAFEANERGLLGKEYTDGLDLTWGSGEAAVKLVEMIAYRRGIGDLLADGVHRAARKLGPAAADLDLTVKGLEMPAHDPRGFVSMAPNYATANRGACHLESISYWNAYGIKHNALGYDHPLDPHDSTHAARLAYDYQNYMQLYNPLGLCKFIAKGNVGPDMLCDLVNESMGWNWTVEDYMETGERLFQLKRMINNRYGITSQDDRLPARLTTLARPTGKAAGVLPDMDRIMPEYYALRGWDEAGRPKREIIARLGLSAGAELANVPSRLLAESLCFDGEMMHVGLTDGRYFSVPITRLPFLNEATPEQRNSYKIDRGGASIHWPETGQEVSVTSLMEA